MKTCKHRKYHPGHMVRMSTNMYGPCKDLHIIIKDVCVYTHIYTCMYVEDTYMYGHGNQLSY